MHTWTIISMDSSKSFCQSEKYIKIWTEVLFVTMHLILRSNGIRDLSALRNSPGGEQVAGEKKENKRKRK